MRRDSSKAEFEPSRTRAIATFVASSGCPECAAIRRQTPMPTTFRVAPLAGGGWMPWRNAVVRLMHHMATQPTHALIIGQPGRNQRYVQAQIGWGIGLAQASSNVYLMGRSRLSARKEQQLVELGWLPPHSDRDAPDAYPANWGLPLVDGDWDRLGDLFLATITKVFAFRGDLPVEVRTFLCDNPCAHCSWADVDPLPPHGVKLP
jgi:hypothetical protein